MEILLAQNSPYYPGHGGGDKSNRLLLEALARRGHDCRVVARIPPTDQGPDLPRFLEELACRRVPDVLSERNVVRFSHNGVQVHALTSEARPRVYLGEQIANDPPSLILASTDDPLQLFLGAALGAREAHLVYLIRTTLSLPFGPEGAFPSEELTERLHQCDAVVAVSQYVADYVKRWSGIPAKALPISLLDPGPHPNVGGYDNEFVTMVNPCAVKGVTIFLEMARRMPDVRFAAVPLWGTTREDLTELRKLDNITLLDRSDDIADILRRTRVLLAPSVWAEARSRIIVEAMLHGVPVLASNVGGIPEAMMGVDYLLPVRQIKRYEHRVNLQMVPVAEVPEQDVTPWTQTLQELLGSRERYAQLAARSRAAALDYAGNLSIDPFEQIAERVVEAPPNPQRVALGKARTDKVPVSRTAKLSPEKRALLALRLKRKTVQKAPRGNVWFPGIEQTQNARLRLFTFPYAGGGVGIFRGWSDALPADIALCPARLPGRESRGAEAPIEKPERLIEAIAEALAPHLDLPFAFLGYCMGAFLAFELTRWLRRRSLPQPRCLLVAGSRAPQFRLNHVPHADPSDEELVDEFREMEYAAKEALENEDLLRLLLPALRADSKVGRVYTYEEEPPLDVPIRAYVGTEDPRLPPEVIEAWKEQTTSSFRMRLFRGGHFFMHSVEEKEFQAVVCQELEEIS